MQAAPKGVRASAESTYKADTDTTPRATSIADKLKVDFGLINRSPHVRTGSTEASREKILVGDVKDKVRTSKHMAHLNLTKRTPFDRLPS